MSLRSHCCRPLDNMFSRTELELYIFSSISDDATTTTTTTTRTPRDCEFNGVRHAEGTLVEGAGGECQKCYCLNGVVNCTTVCAPAVEGCEPVMQEGHCCPVKYNCDDGIRTVSVDDVFKHIPVKVNTADHSKEFERLLPEWYTNMARKSPGGEEIIADRQDGQFLLENHKETSLASPEKSALTEENPKEQNSEDENDPAAEDEELQSRRQLPHPRKQISRLSPEDIANRRKQSRYTIQRRPNFPRRREPTQSLSFRFRQRIKQNNEQSKNDQTTEEPKLSPSSPTSSPSTNGTTTVSAQSSLDATTHQLHLSASLQMTADENINEEQTTVYEEYDSVTEANEDLVALNYGPVPGIVEVQDPNVQLKNSKVPDDSELLKSTSLEILTPKNLQGSSVSEFSISSPMSPTSIPITTSASSILITTEFEDQQVSEVIELGHPGEVFLLHNISELSTTTSLPNLPIKPDEQIEVGVGVNVKGSLEDAVRFGPILIFDNRVRTDRQQKDTNATELTEEMSQEGEESTVVTDIPEETTITIRDEISNEDKTAADNAMIDRELSTDYDTGTEELTTLFPTQPHFQDTTMKSLNETHSNLPLSVTDDLEYTFDNIPDYNDKEDIYPSYDITVGTSVLANSQGPPQSSGIGEVIPVDLEPEHKAPEPEETPVVEERPSILGTILDILTRTERPVRPKPVDIFPPPPPPPPPFRSPFRPRPRPEGRPNPRPDFVPPRFRFTPPPPPSPPVISDRVTTNESEANFLTSPPSPLPTSTSRPTIFTVQPDPPINAINRPAAGTSRPKPVINSPVHSSNERDRPIRPDFLPKPINNRPVAPSDILQGLPSKPVIEGGFLGMKDEEGVQPDLDYVYDTDGEPKLPPSLPNLKIIPFVAADAVTEGIGIAGDEFKESPLLLAETGKCC
ncbi:hypothetical protein SK128_017437 [Halocaridina rubra]|uniref:VWFC domain-containing protein n=1 Tax=Halocaridina rubra TaxID=373956 RepID=A0AAN9FU03_HALRR